MWLWEEELDGVLAREGAYQSSIYRPAEGECSFILFPYQWRTVSVDGDDG
jgi:hypothetical protein